MHLALIASKSKGILDAINFIFGSWMPTKLYHFFIKRICARTSTIHFCNFSLVFVKIQFCFRFKFLFLSFFIHDYLHRETQSTKLKSAKIETSLI